MIAAKDCAEKHMALFVHGLLMRDWAKIKNALVLVAVDYHNGNALEFHPGSAKLDFKPSEEALAIISAALWIFDREAKGEI